MRSTNAGTGHAAAIRHLSKADPVLGRLMAEVGPCRLAARPGETFEALLESIVHQQLNGKAARTIHDRVLRALGGKATPARLSKTPDAARGSRPPSSPRRATWRRNAWRERSRRGASWSPCPTRKSSRA